jgi:hypothetical protein
MMDKQSLILGLARACLVILLLGIVVRPVMPGFAAARIAVADDDKGHDDHSEQGGEQDKGKGHDKANKDNGNKGKDKKDKKDKKGDDEDTVVVAPNVTPIPATVLPSPTAVPEQTGTLRVVAMSCQTRPADGADWKAVCTTAVDGALFDLEGLDGPFAQWHRDLKADAAGTAALDRLPAARYQLVQLNDDWCRAESDRVDAAGDVVIEGGNTTTVWVFNCATTAVGS